MLLLLYSKFNCNVLLSMRCRINLSRPLIFVKILTNIIVVSILVLSLFWLTCQLLSVALVLGHLLFVSCRLSFAVFFTRAFNLLVLLLTRVNFNHDVRTRQQVLPSRGLSPRRRLFQAQYGLVITYGFFNSCNLRSFHRQVKVLRVLINKSC